MKQYKAGRYFIFAIIGFIIFAAGIAGIKLLPETGGILKMLTYLCVGFGSGVFGSSLGTALTNKAIMMNSQAAKQLEIEQKDERNQAISDKAKARTYDLMIFVYAAILLAFALMKVDIYVIMTMAAVYLFFVSANVYYRLKYHKEW